MDKNTHCYVHRSSQHNPEVQTTEADRRISSAIKIQPYTIHKRPNAPAEQAVPPLRQPQSAQGPGFPVQEGCFSEKLNSHTLQGR